MHKVTYGEKLEKWLKIKNSCEYYFSSDENSCVKICDPDKCPKIKENFE